MVGTVRFSRSAEGVITGFVMNAPGVRGLRFNRTR
jgi:hypothetical protein